ncbi:membrane protein [Leifsonia kafniensis]|uniref:Membrane protein n=1 Tax=Leifsonia kafniensis TaxID=475957 RepID=A0ABP7K1F7_9MICO
MSTVHTSGWVGWGRFAGVIILVSGIFSGIQGLVALIGPNTYYVAAGGSLFLFNVAGWGWWNLIIGILLILTALALFTGAMWARVIAIVLAVLSAIVQMMLIPAQPWWAMIVIAMDVLIIYALTAHGEELRSTES